MSFIHMSQKVKWRMVAEKLEKQFHDIAMVCTCSPKAKQKVSDYFEASSPWFARDDKEALDAMLMRMTGLWEGKIEIIGDQWYAVVYETKDDIYRVECDRPVDGIVRIYHEVFGHE